MKITKSSNEASRLNALKETANAGCLVCPCCGEKKSHVQYMKEEGVFTHKGVSGGIYRSWAAGGFFKKIKNMRVDCYQCYTCGAQWESEPYEW